MKLTPVIKAGVCCFRCAAPSLQHRWHCASWLHILEPLTSWMWRETYNCLFFDACYWHSDWRDFSGIAVSPSCSWKYSIEQSVPSWRQTFQKHSWTSSLVSQSCQSQMLVWKSEKMSNTVWVMAVSPWEPLCLCQYFARDTGSEAFGQSISHTVYLPLSPLQSGVFVFW